MRTGSLLPTTVITSSYVDQPRVVSHLLHCARRTCPLDRHAWAVER